MVWQWLPFVLSGVTILAMWLAGRKDKRAWAIGLANQVLWLGFIWHTQSWGLLVLTGALPRSHPGAMRDTIERMFALFKEATHARHSR